jgi:L-threo-3-deoxy-hexylosonate aldolase
MSTMDKPRNPLRPGVYAPVLTFFDPDTEDLDIPTIRQHAVRLAKAGLVGLVTMGSNGEAVHLSREERKVVTQETRSALNEAGYRDVPIIVGSSEQSIRGTIGLCKESAEAGADYVLVLPPSYYTRNNNSILYEYFTGVADGSPVPVILYNYPGAVSGIDMDSNLIISIAQHRNIVGAKFTCANTGKLTRVAHAVNAITPPSPFNCTERGRSHVVENHPFVTFGGMADFALQTLVSGGSAIIAGGANVLPRTCVQIFNLWSRGDIVAAMELQGILSAADWVLAEKSIPGTKFALQHYFGYGGYARRPLLRLTEAQLSLATSGVEKAMEYEKSLPDFGAASA